MAVGAVGTTTNFEFDADLLTAGDVGKYLRWRSNRLRITVVTDARHGTGVWVDPTTGITDPTAPTTDWQHEAWSSTYGWPGCGLVMDGRLWLAASTRDPSAVWASQPGAFFNFDVANGEDGDAIAENVGGLNTVPRVLHLFPGTRLLVFSDVGVWYVPSSDSRPVTPSTIAFRAVSEVGCSAPRPALNDGAVMYVDASGRTVREARWSFALDGFTADPISIVAEHLVQSPVSMTSVLGNTNQPARLGVLVNGDGTMSAVHSLSSERITAWVPWVTDGTVTAAAGVLGRLFVAVTRNGTARLERFNSTAAPLDALASATSATVTRTFSGFSHLIGRTVAVVTNGHDLGDVVVASDGTITLNAASPAVLTIDAGLRFEQIVRPLPIDADLPDGDASSLRKRLMRVLMVVNGSGDFVVKGRTVTLGFQGDDFTTAPTVYSGTVEVRVYGVSPECQFDITVPKANRVTILSITREVQVNG